jgi:hypothetical protein
MHRCSLTSLGVKWCRRESDFAMCVVNKLYTFFQNIAHHELGFDLVLNKYILNFYDIN